MHAKHAAIQTRPKSEVSFCSNGLYVGDAKCDLFRRGHGKQIQRRSITMLLTWTFVAGLLFSARAAVPFNTGPAKDATKRGVSIIFGDYDGCLAWISPWNPRLRPPMGTFPNDEMTDEAGKDFIKFPYTPDSPSQLLLYDFFGYIKKRYERTILVPGTNRQSWDVDLYNAVGKHKKWTEYVHNDNMRDKDLISVREIVSTIIDDPFEFYVRTGSPIEAERIHLSEKKRAWSYCASLPSNGFALGSSFGGLAAIAKIFDMEMHTPLLGDFPDIQTFNKINFDPKRSATTPYAGDGSTWRYIDKSTSQDLAERIDRRGHTMVDDLSLENLLAEDGPRKRNGAEETYRTEGWDKATKQALVENGLRYLLRKNILDENERSGRVDVFFVDDRMDLLDHGTCYSLSS